MANMQAAESEMSSNLSEVITEALATYTADKGAHDRTAMAIARNQAKYQRLGVSAEIVRLMHKESKLTQDERHQKYADELRYRRAVSLWDADSEEDFDRAMQQASETSPAAGNAADLLIAARSYNDGFNSSAHGKVDADANPHVPGTQQHAEWSKGHRDGLRQMKALGVEPVDPQAVRGRGRPRKDTHEQPATNGPAADEGAGLLGGFPSTMPT